MKREWKPGDVAMVTFASGQEGLAVYGTSDTGRRYDNCWRFGRGAFEWHDSDKITAARPLVVIDPESEDDVTRLADALVDHHSKAYGVESDWLSIQAALREFANPTPPKPEEPLGLGAVVEDAVGELFIRDKTTTTVAHWKRARGEDGGARYRYADLRTVRVLSQGVTR